MSPGKRNSPARPAPGEELMKTTKSHKKYTTLLLIFLCLLCLFVANTAGNAAVEQSEMRCGWFSNPTPGNASLHEPPPRKEIRGLGGHQTESGKHLSCPQQR